MSVLSSSQGLSTLIIFIHSDLIFSSTVKASAIFSGLEMRLASVTTKWVISFSQVFFFSIYCKHLLNSRRSNVAHETPGSKKTLSTTILGD